MFYLIVCDKDKSLCTVEDFEIVCDPDQPPKLDDEVEFFYGKERFSGSVVGMSENSDLLKEKAKKLKFKRKPSTSPVLTSPLPLKRYRKPKKGFSFTDDTSDFDNKKSKKPKKDDRNKDKGTINLQEQVKYAISDGNGSTGKTKQQSTANKTTADHQKTSPTKEELKIMLEKQNQIIALYRTPTDKKSTSKIKALQKKIELVSEDSDSSASDHSNGSPTPDIPVKETIDNSEKMTGSGSETRQGKVYHEGDEISNPQLWGENCGEAVVLLKNNIYCKKATLESAEDQCRKSATSFLRRLMDGVFKPDVLLNLNCTYSGRPPSAQGKQKQLEKVVPLDRDAKKAVIEYCDEYATQKRWPKVKESELRNAMSQWIGELKRAHQKNLGRNL